MNQNCVMESEIDTASGPISVMELSYFLYHFRVAYVAALHVRDERGIKEISSEEEADMFANEVAEYLSKIDTFQIRNFALLQLIDNEDLTFLNINRRNPLDIVFGGVAIALTAAVILSGGDFKLGPLHVKLPPLGKGIAELRKALKGIRTPKNQPDNKYEPTP